MWRLATPALTSLVGPEAPAALPDFHNGPHRALTAEALISSRNKGVKALWYSAGAIAIPGCIHNG
jgi:hypothetical protein